MYFNTLKFITIAMQTKVSVKLIQALPTKLVN